MPLHEVPHSFFLSSLIEKIFQKTPTEISSSDQNGPAPSENFIETIFHRVPPYYDLMNDLMSGGTHRLWKDDFTQWINPSPHDKILDLASGTGDLSQRIRERLSPFGSILECDLSLNMLKKATRKAYDRGDLSLSMRVQANAQTLPFFSHSFDKVCIAFGLRNIQDRHSTLREIHRVLKPHGTLFCLEFSHMEHPLLETLFHRYGKRIIPYLGELIVQDQEAYFYLMESISSFPSQEALCKEFEKAHFSNVIFENRLGGIIAFHKGYKL